MQNGKPPVIYQYWKNSLLWLHTTWKYFSHCYIDVKFDIDSKESTTVHKTIVAEDELSQSLNWLPTSHSAYVATSTESNGAKIDGF